MEQLQHAVNDILKRCESLLNTQADTPMAVSCREDIRDIQEATQKLQMLLHNITQQQAVSIHDLRTPLSVIIGFSEIIVDSDEVDTYQRDEVQRIYDQGSYLLATINHTFDKNNRKRG